MNIPWSRGEQVKVHQETPAGDLGHDCHAAYAFNIHYATQQGSDIYCRPCYAALAKLVLGFLALQNLLIKSREYAQALADPPALYEAVKRQP